jgi:hypothetical protein
MTLSGAESGHAPAAVANAEFRISTDVVNAIQHEFSFRLTPEEIVQLQIAAWETIDLRRSLLRSKENGDLRRQYVETKKRRDRIAKATSRLRKLLDADELADRPWRLNVSMNALDRSLSVRDDVAPTLTRLEWLTQTPHPLELRGKPWKKGRRPNVDSVGWIPVISTAIGFFYERDVPPTANPIQVADGGWSYSSRLLRGLEELHCALPGDVQAPSASALRSPTAEFIRKIKKSGKEGRK